MDNSYVPSPVEIERAVGRINKIASVTFELLLGTWRTVVLTEAHPLYNRVRPDLTIIYFKPVLVIATPYMPSIDAWLAVTLASIDSGHTTLVPIGSEVGQRVGFKPSSDEAERWLRLQFARAQGMKFRSHGMVNTDKIVYTKEA